MKIINIKKALSWAMKSLKKASGSPALDAEVLLCDVLNRDKAWIYANPEFKLSRIQHSKFKTLISQRARLWPVAYLVGRKEFFGHDFKVTPDVLIPRPETETLVELALKRISLPARGGVSRSEGGVGEGRGRINIIDIGTGSGNIIISLVKGLQNKPSSPGVGRRWRRGRTTAYKFYAVDDSIKAIQVAKLNARRHKISKRIKFLHGNLLAPLSPFFENWKLKIGNCLVLANLPYLTKKQLNNSTIKHEPKEALYGGPEGLKYYRELFRQVSNIQHAKYNILIEYSPAQKPALARIAQKYFPKTKINFRKDLAGKYRVVEIQTSFLPHAKPGSEAKLYYPAKGEIERG